MPDYEETRIAELLRSLPPAPTAWVTAAKELPRANRELERLLPMLERDAELRAAMNQDLEAALEQIGIEPEPGLVAAVRRRLGRFSAPPPST
jgi:hypothetical protein